MFWSKNRTKIFKAISLIWSSHPLVSFHYFRIWSQIILGELLVLFSSTFHLQIFFLKCSGQKTEPKYLMQFCWYEVVHHVSFPYFRIWRLRRGRVCWRARPSSWAPSSAISGSSSSRGWPSAPTPSSPSGTTSTAPTRSVLNRKI